MSLLMRDIKTRDLQGHNSKKGAHIWKPKMLPATITTIFYGMLSRFWPIFGSDQEALIVGGGGLKRVEKSCKLKSWNNPDVVDLHRSRSLKREEKSRRPLLSSMTRPRLLLIWPSFLSWHEWMNIEMYLANFWHSLDTPFVTKIWLLKIKVCMQRRAGTSVGHLAL